ncbi:CynX/NimT family MFS transporter [Halomonas piscis]|uniref:CynX/NimT family MFS transporter n=1 Tax=Halomonas piscis TaxID=3031727 RepID=UPI002896D1C5|nr:CynX/NimT family MFS transporter [Halomonas piscis]
MTTPSSTASRTADHTETLQFVGGVLLIMALGLNLRPLLASASPLMEDIRTATGLGYGVLAWLTTLPFLCMGAVALASGRIARLLGESRGIMLSLGAIGVACALRQAYGTGLTLLSTALLGGAGIALIQALVPGLVKRRFGARMPLVMGLYSASLMSGGGLSSWVSPRIAELGGWQLGVGIWWVPALVTLAGWFLIFRRRAAAPADATAIEGVRPWRLKRAWLLALYFGVINAGYSSVVTWLPVYYQELGRSAVAGGRLLAWMTIFQVLAALTMPAIAQRQKTADRRWLLATSLIAQLVGYLGFIFMPQSLALWWNAIAGFGLGACFSLGLILALDHLPDARAAGRLAAFMQGFGFMLNALSPWISGILRETTGSFIAAWALLAIGIVAMLVVTLRFSPARYPQVMQSPGQ